MVKQLLNFIRPSAGRELLAAGLLVSLFYLGFRNVLTPAVTCSMFLDNTYLYHPILNFLGDVFRSGEHPLWMNTIGGGISLYNNPQLSPLYPFYFLTPGQYGTPETAMLDAHLNYLFHSFVLLINSYILFRVAKFHPVAAAAGAALLTVSPEFASYRFWINMIAPYSWMPLALAGILAILNRNYILGATMTVIGASLLTLASPSHPLIQAVYLCSGAALYGLIKSAASESKKILFEKCALFALCGAVCAAITSPLIVSMLQFMNESIRFVGVGHAVKGGEAIPLDAMTEGQYSLPALSRVWFPSNFSSVVGDAYIGGCWFAIAVLGFLVRARLNGVKLVGLLALYTLISAAGSHTPLFQLNLVLPLINKIREPAHFLVFFTYLCAFLAAFAVEECIHRVRSKKSWIINLVGVTALAVAGLVWASKLSLPGNGFPQWSALYQVLALCLGSFLLARMMPPRWSPLFVCLPVFFAVWNTTLYPGGCPPVTASDYYAPANQESHRVLKSVAEIPGVGDYRVLFEFTKPELSSQQWAMNASYHNIRTLEAYMNPLPAEQFATIWQAHGMVNYGLVLGVKYVLCDSCERYQTGGYKLRQSFDKISLYENDSASPYINLVSRAADTYNGKELFYNAIAARLPEAGAAYFPVEAAPIKSAEGDFRIISSSKNHNSRSLKVSGPGGVLVLNEYLAKEWKASVDGNPTVLEPVNLNQIGVRLGSGEHSIEFVYSPTLYLRLLMLQRVTIWLALAVLLFFVLRRVTKSFQTRK